MEASGELRALRPYVDGLYLGEAISHENLTLMPLASDGQEHVSYVLGAEAMATGELVVTEVDDQGSVPELLVTNAAETNVLLLEGEELVGAKQNRILNASILLAPKSRTKIPVSCVEQGRWRHASASFSSGGYSPSSLRGSSSSDVYHSLRMRRKAHSNQSKIWAFIRRYLKKSKTTSDSAAMHDAMEQHRSAFSAYVEALSYPAGARGVVVAVDGSFVALDLFDRPQAMERAWQRLVRSYTMDAFVGQGSSRKRFHRKDAQGVLWAASELECEPLPSVGLGKDWRFETETLVGHALVVEDACVHLCIFPNSRPEERDEPETSLEPPSARQHLGR